MNNDVIKAKMTILGSSATIPDLSHDNTSMVLSIDETTFMIDCPGSPVRKLLRADVDWVSLNGLIVTHHHPDHIYGVPMLLMDLWLSSRSESFPIYGPARTLDAIDKIMSVFEWEFLPSFIPVEFREIPQKKNALVFSNDVLEIRASPVSHMITNIGLRFLNRLTGRVLVYTSDTARSSDVVSLAKGADILIHEAAGPYPGHSSGTDAAMDAVEAGVNHLALIHYPVSPGMPEQILKDAEEVFNGHVELAADYQVYEF